MCCQDENTRTRAITEVKFQAEPIRRQTNMVAQEHVKSHRGADSRIPPTHTKKASVSSPKIPKRSGRAERSNEEARAWIA